MIIFFHFWQIKALHQYDCLRANKATSAWGLEARVPFLDKEFINIAMTIDPEWKMVFGKNFVHMSCGFPRIRYMEHVLTVNHKNVVDQTRTGPYREMGS